MRALEYVAAPVGAVLLGVAAVCLAVAVLGSGPAGGQPAVAQAPLPVPQQQPEGYLTRTITYTYDPLGRLTGAEYSTGERYEYAYDAVGNRTAYTVTTPLAGTAVTTYTYDAANRLLISSSPQRLITYTWDARGNLIGDGTFTYTYNAAGRLVRAQSITATVVYTYTADGLRVGQAVAGAVTTYAWDWAAAVPELLQTCNLQSAICNLYLIGHETLGWWDGVAWAYILPDGLGSVRQAADGAGAVVRVREWTPYGEEVGGWQAGLGYTGEWQDAAVGLVYLRARWYAPGVGIFTAPDPFPGVQTEPGSLQPYRYVLGNPVNRTDPSGRYGKDEVHFRLTLLWAEQLAVTYCASPICAIRSLQYWIAWGDKHMDDVEPTELFEPGRHQEFHFVSKVEAWEDIQDVPTRGAGDPVLFGAALHELQDYWSHRYEGYALSLPSERGHAEHSARARLRDVLGLVDEFYGRGRYQNVPSQYTVGSREKVEAELAYLGADLSHLADNSLIDLWLRESILLAGRRDDYRNHYGYNTDAYFWFSIRDQLMEEDTREAIAWFYEQLGDDPCAVFDLLTYTPPSNSKIVSFLRGR